MERYLGLDVHRDSCTWVVLSAAGKRVRRDRVETNGQALVGYVKGLAGRLHVCLEEGEWSEWLVEILSPHVVEVVVYRPQWRPGAKNDRIDAYDLAERLRTGKVGCPVYKAPRRWGEASLVGAGVREADPGRGACEAAVEELVSASGSVVSERGDLRLGETGGMDKPVAGGDVRGGGAVGFGAGLRGGASAESGAGDGSRGPDGRMVPRSEDTQDFVCGGAPNSQPIVAPDWP